MEHGRPAPIFRDNEGRWWLIPARLSDEQKDEMPAFVDFAVVEWKGIFYELQGQHPRTGWWWVERLDVEAEVAAA